MTRKWLVVTAFLSTVLLSLPRWHQSTTTTSEQEANRHANTTAPFKFIFGVSTGHAGSTTSQNTTMRDGCPFTSIGAFEYTAFNELTWKYESINRTCQRVNASLIPRLYQFIPEKNQVFVDLGHYHNRGAVLECLADLLQDKAVFVRIRRNRYDIAMSFSSLYYTPCLTYEIEQDHPVLSTCPRSTERRQAGPVHLHVRDYIWDSFTPFQRFLWYADEMEEKWHVLTAKNRGKSPRFHEITWSSSEELKQGLFELRQSFGCNDEQQEIDKHKIHITHKAGIRNCSDMIRQDLEYRRLMRYSRDKERYQRLFGEFPQHVDSSDCKDSGDELMRAIRQYSDGSEEVLYEWVLAS